MINPWVIGLVAEHAIARASVESPTAPKAMTMMNRPLFATCAPKAGGMRERELSNTAAKKRMMNQGKIRCRETCFLCELRPLIQEKRMAMGTMESVRAS